MGDNSWAMQRDTLNHAGPTSSPANLSYGRETAPCQGSLVRLQTQYLCGGACHSGRQRRAGAAGGAAGAAIPLTLQPEGTVLSTSAGSGRRLRDPHSPFSVEGVPHNPKSTGSGGCPCKCFHLLSLQKLDEGYNKGKGFD